jgi:hypothetical protein
MKINTQYVRKKFEVNPKTIKEMVVLEESLISGQISKCQTSKLSQFYQQFIDYCHCIREPLKLYFQEKLEYLFLNEKIFKMLLQDQTPKNESENTQLLGNSFLKFSEIENKNDKIMQKYISDETSNIIKVPQSIH